MAKPGKQLDSAGVAIAVDNIKDFLGHYNVTRKQLAHGTGIAPSTISELLSLRYKGDVTEKIAKIEDWINAWLRSNDAPTSSTFTETSIAIEIFKLIKLVEKNKAIGVIYCASGVGKSMAAEAYIQTHARHGLLVRADPGSSKPLAFCQALLGQISTGRTMPYSIRSRANAFNLLKERLGTSARLILIDEADILSMDTLDLIRHLHDKTHCPIVLIGRPQLRETLKRTTRSRAIGGSLRGRILIERDLMLKFDTKDPHRWLFSLDDVVKVLKTFEVRFSADAGRWLCALANLTAFDGQEENGGLRYAAQVFQLAVTAFPGERITSEHLKQANYFARDQDYVETISYQIEQFLKHQQRKAATA